MSTSSDNQLTSLEANQSRFVSKLRFVVEVNNGLVTRKFKALKKIKNRMLPHIIDDYRIAAVYFNCFGARVLSDKNDYVKLANRMKLRSELNNELEKYIKYKNYTFIKSKLKQIDVIDIDDFPKYDLKTIRKNITF